MKDLQLRSEINNDGLQLNSIILDEAYKKKWKIGSTDDYKCLTMNGKLLRNTLYRVGGIGQFRPKTDRFHMILKYVEAQYSKDIIKMSKSKSPNYLNGLWCILDSNGNELVTIPNSLYYAHLINNSIFYTYRDEIINILTNEVICKYGKYFVTENYIFAETSYDTKTCSVIKIDKQTGEIEKFK